MRALPVDPAPLIPRNSFFWSFRAGRLVHLRVDSFVILLAQLRYQPAPVARGTTPFEWVLLALIAIAAALLFASFWKIFQKAGRPGWAALIPIYNVFVWLEILGRPPWLVVLSLVPYANILLEMFLCTDTSKAFGKRGIGFTLGLMFLPFVFFPILAFGSARYLGPVDDDGSPTTIG